MTIDSRFTAPHGLQRTLRDPGPHPLVQPQRQVRQPLWNSPWTEAAQPNTKFVQSPRHLGAPHAFPIPSTMAAPPVNEMEHFQQLSDRYKPHLPGPLIGQKRPLSDLVTEYAHADQAYITKTSALVVTHATYRPVKGDGQCGWRGAVFGYFEILLKAADLGLITQESVRLQSFEETMRAVGIDYDIIVDMFECTWELLGAIKSAIERHDKTDAVILESMNNEPKSDSIVYHFKMMTSSFMQIHPDRYEPFLEMPVAQYCLTRIDPTNQEIDHIGLQALTDAVIAPAYIALEVSYLDRSTGAEVTPHQFVPDARNWPTIRLIYRPGHYDIIYKDETPIQVMLQTNTPRFIPPYQNDIFQGDVDTLDMHSFMFPTAHLLPTQQVPKPTPLSSSAEELYASQFLPHPPLAIRASGPVDPVYPDFLARNTLRENPVLPPHVGTLPPRSYTSPALHPPLRLSPSQTPSPLTPSSGVLSPQTMTRPKEPQIRYSENCFNYSLRRHESLPLDPGSFGSSTLSPAHFANNDFQPEMWNAAEEYHKRD